MKSMTRIVVIGTSCSGKTTVGRQLSRILDIKFVELDAVNWLPGWQMRSTEEFRQIIGDVAAEEKWVIDGNYKTVRDIVWPRATHIIWLNYSFISVFRQALARTIVRAWNKEELWSGNRETFRQSFLSRDSILLWVIKTYRRNKKKYMILLKQKEYAHIKVVELKKPHEAEKFLQTLENSDKIC